MAYQGNLRDTCLIGSQATPSGVEPTNAWTYAATAVRCRYTQAASREIPEGTGAEITNGKIRLALQTTISASNRLKLTHKNGTALSPAVEFLIVGEPRITRTIGILCDVQCIAGVSAG